MGDTDAVVRLVKAGADANSKDGRWRDALWHVANVAELPATEKQRLCTLIWRAKKKELHANDNVFIPRRNAPARPAGVFLSLYFFVSLCLCVFVSALNQKSAFKLLQ